MRMVLKDGKTKCLTLSYDDGVIQDIRLVEIMQRYGLKGTFNLNSGLFFPENKKREHGERELTLSQAKKLFINSGNEVAVHTFSHPFLEQLTEAEMINEIMTDRKNLSREFCCVANGMAYPMGTYDQRVVEVLKKCAIAYARTIKSTESFAFPTNWLTLNPTCHHNNKRLMELAEKFAAGDPWNRSTMFYLWGHSFEFDNDNNWDVIENFAKYMGFRDDVWYASNIEIYNYVMAYNRLQTSADQKIIYNPSDISVWASDKDGIFCIKSGEVCFR